MKKDNKQKVLIFFCLFLPWLISGCSPFIDIKSSIDFPDFQDSSITKDISRWLEGGAQSKITDSIKEVAVKISGRNRRERLYKSMDYIWKNFSYDIWLNSLAFTQTAENLFESKKLGGCSDFALVQITLFRAVGIPSRMIITANVDWMVNSRSNILAMSEGHSFIEVFLEDNWHLVDTTYRWLFSGYNLNNKSYPHGEYFCKRGIDFWDMGIRNSFDSDNILKDLASNYNDDYKIPLYEKYPI